MVKELLKHLLFSEVINENVKLNKYIELVQNIENKTFLEKNFDRETILIFELAIDDKFDPWDIDITKFVKLYLQRLQNEKNINLCLAGYLILLCWHILKIQSSKIIDKYTLKNQIEMLSWDAIPDWHETSQQPTITPLLTRNETKKITFYDFIKAFEDIKNKISTKELQTQINAHYKKEFFANAVKLINSSVHPENIENYIGKLWQKSHILKAIYQYLKLQMVIKKNS